ncbi:MAG: hypothetical protein ACTSWL_07685 [Promethearchaeota archaeon]
MSESKQNLNYKTVFKGFTRYLKEIEEPERKIKITPLSIIESIYDDFIKIRINRNEEL